jgi:seryl-tRNA synthetase
MRHLLLCVSLLLIGGCGKPLVDNSQDPEAYARDVKQLVFNEVASAAKSREPADQMVSVINELQQTDRPRGSYQATYDQLLKKAQEIQAECQKAGKGKPANLTTRLDELKKLAQSLPGDVKAPVEEGPTKKEWVD